MNGLFITGTDTDIGKTALSALLLAELRRRKINAAPMKPAQTGCGGKGLSPEALGFRGVPDLDYSLAMASMMVDSKTYANMSPYTFEPACSPHLAAEMAGAEIDLAEIVIAARTLAADYEFIIAEGAGGIMVPLTRRAASEAQIISEGAKHNFLEENNDHREWFNRAEPGSTMLDLMHAMRLPIVIAARPGLGTINHTLLSIRALRSDGLDIAGVVFVASTDEESGLIEEDNATTIEQFGKVPILGTIPYCAALQTPAPDYSSLPVPVVAEMERIANKLGM